MAVLATNTRIGVGGKLGVSSGGSATSTTIDSGGAEIVSGGGIDFSATINDGGLQVVQSGGSATDTTVSDPGLQIISAGGSVTGAVLSGEQDVYGSATGTTVDSGGLQGVESVGAASGTTINGGVEYVFSGGAAANVAFGSGGGSLKLEAPSGLTGPISNWQIGDTIDFVDTSVTSAGISGSTLSVTADGQTYTYQLIGQQADTQTSLTSDNSGSVNFLHRWRSRRWRFDDFRRGPGQSDNDVGSDRHALLRRDDRRHQRGRDGHADHRVFRPHERRHHAEGNSGDADEILDNSFFFTPTAGQPNTSATTTFTLSDASSAYPTPTTDSTTTVTDVDPAVALTMTGIKSGQTTTSEMPIHPFASVMIGDANNGGTNVDTLTITLLESGTLSQAGPAGAGDVYTLMGTAEQLTSELQAMVFTPVDGVPNTSVLNAFALVVKDPAFAFPGNSVGNDFTQVIDSDPAVAPTILGTVANQPTTTSEAPVTPWSRRDDQRRQQRWHERRHAVHRIRGSRRLAETGLMGSSGSYSLMGTAAAITTALDALVFTPANGVPNTSVTTAFTLNLTDTVTGGNASNSATTVKDTDPAIPPTSTIAETVTLAPGGSPSISVTGVAADVDSHRRTVTMNGGSVSLLRTDGGQTVATPSGREAHSYVATITDNLGLHSSVTGSIVSVNNAKTIALAGTIGGDTVNASTGNSQIGVTDTAANGGHNSISMSNA